MGYLKNDEIYNKQNRFGSNFMKQFTSDEIREFVSKPIFDEQVIQNIDPSFPKISIITPSYNQAQFIERTILSVLNQNYPSLEYIIIDGGSTDGTLDIIKKYEKYLAYWASEPDDGQVDAINKGFKKSTGDILAWQNSDDTYNPGALIKAVEYLNENKKIDLILGDFYFIDAKDNKLQEVRHRPFSKWEYLYHSPNITNQSAFFRRELLFKTDLLDPKYHYAMDFDFFVRASDYGQFKYIKYFFGNLRMHDDSKTVLTGTKVDWHREYANVRKRYGIHMDLNRPWKDQYKIKKIYFKLRRLFYYLFGGNLDYIWKKLRKDPLTLLWNTKKKKTLKEKTLK